MIEMDLIRSPLVLALCLITVALANASQGPVFINPNNAAAVAPTATANQASFVTQTVYGFLDFTTTIGNTIMVFSPQSAAIAIPETPKVSTNEIVSNNVIDSKPAIAQKELEIKPSKTQIPKEKKSSENVFSVVQVQSNPPPAPSTRVDIQSSAMTKVNVIEGKSSIKAAHQPLQIVNKVQAVETPSTKPTSTQNIITKVEVINGPTKLEPIIASRVEIQSRENSDSNLRSSIVQVKSDDEPAAIIGNNIGEPEYDFLSRQPSEVVEETFKVINLKPSSKFILKHRPSAEPRKNAAATKRGGGDHPTGLVTKLGGTVVKDGITTVIETSVIGTYISGKYAQVLQSTSRKINPTQSLRILKTAAPSLGKGSKHRHVEPTPAGAANEEVPAPHETPAQNSIKSARKAGSGSGSLKRFKNRHKEPDVNVEDNEHEVAPVQPNYKKSQKNRSQSQSSRNSKHNTSSNTPRKTKSRRNRNRKRTSQPSVHSEEPPTTSTSGKRFSGRKNKQTKVAAQETGSTSGFNRRGYKPKVQPSNVDQFAPATSSLYKFKLNRSPGRWQYKTTSKPRVTIRKQNIDESANNNETLGTTSSSPQEASHPLVNDVVSPQARSDDGDSLEGSESIASIIDDESSTENRLDAPAFPVETIKVEISTPPDFGDIYYEIATIKSPYTFQVGSVKNTRYVTVTSTFEKSLEPSQDPSPAKASEPLTENILATSSNYGKDNNFLDSSIATLPPLYLASDMETPPLETLTETFSTTQTMLKTHILPVVRHGNDTRSSTLVQTYLVTRVVTATKTLPPMDAYHFIPSRTLNEFNSHLDEAGSELHLELEFGDQNDQDDGQLRKISLPADLDLANIGSNFDLSDVEKSKILEGHLRPKKAQSPLKPMNDLPNQGFSPDQLQQLALYRLLNQGAPQGQVITTSKPVLKVETVYETFVLQVTQGHNTIQSTISKLKGTFTKTEFEFGTSTIAPAFQLPQIPQQLPQIPQLPPQLPQLPQLNPFLPQPQPQFAITSSPVVQTTMVTQTNSKILKLTFGAKTAHTTVYSTVVVPTVTTSYVTASIPVPPTAAYPGYFPAPYPGYPYVG